MPPVLGPRSPSSRRLWSCEVASGTTCLSFATTMKLTSSPLRNSSMTMVFPAAPKLPPSMARAAAMADSCVSQMTTPFPAAKPSALTTSGSRCALTYCSSKLPAVKVAKLAVGMRWRRRKSLVNAFDPSRRAALRDGPKQRRFAAAKRSTMPATSGPSGPTMVRSISSRWQIQAVRQCRPLQCRHC